MKKTKRSLFTSLVTLLLCSAMFVGSTFAWFTDSVSNTGNKIQAGTLDVELYTTEATLTNANISKDNLKTISEGEPSVTYYDVSTLGENNPLFNYNLWEPGYSTPTGFVVKNNGNLALKYELTFFLVDSKTGLEQLEVQKVDEPLTDDAYNERKAHLTKVEADEHLENVIEVYQDETKLGTLKDFFDGKKSFTGHLSAGQTFNTGDLKLLMPTTAGNEYENASISFDIRLLATQYTEEYDGFGSNQYDALADEKPDHTDWERYNTLASDTETIIEGENTVFKTGNNIAEDKQGYTEVTIPANVKAFADNEGKESTIEVETTPILAANNLFTVSSDQGAVGAIDLTVTVNGIEVTGFEDESGEPVEVIVKTFIAKGLTLNNVADKVGVEYNGEGEQPRLISYNSETGELKFATKHFSQFLIDADQVAYLESNNTAYITIKDAVDNMSDNDTLTLLKNNQVGNTVNVSKNIKFDLNGYKLSISNTFYCGRNNSSKAVNIDTEFKNGTVECKYGSGPAIRFETGNKGVFTNVLFTTGDDTTKQAIKTYSTKQSENAEETNEYLFDNCKFDKTYIQFTGASGSLNKYNVVFANCDFSNAKLGNGGSCVGFDDYIFGEALFKNTNFDFIANGNSVSAIYGSAYASYLKGNVMKITLKEIKSNSHYLSGNGYSTIRKKDDSTQFILDDVKCTFENNTIVPADGIVCSYATTATATPNNKATGIKVAINNSGKKIVLTWDNDGKGYSESFELQKGVLFDTNELNYTGTVTAQVGSIIVHEGNVYKAVVAENDGVKYGTINDAINAAYNGEDKVVKLLCDNITDNATLKDGVQLSKNGFIYTKSVSASDSNHAVSYNEESGIYSQVQAICSYANKGYASLADAVKAVTKNNYEIKLLADTSESVQLPTNITYKVNLNTNGKNYTGIVTATEGFEIINKDGVYGVAAVSLKIGDGEVVKYLPTKVKGATTVGTAAYDAKNATADCVMTFLQDWPNDPTEDPWFSGPNSGTLTVDKNGKAVNLHAMSDSTMTDLGDGRYTFVRK